ncbi:hypothetical protein KR52_03760 [Synechococcus sp. KORDI-52]|nr:hypothetical protein KR52_03760 [Synechococcus sp. KORDI-52]
MCFIGITQKKFSWGKGSPLTTGKMTLALGHLVLKRLWILALKNRVSASIKEAKVFIFAIS